MKVNIIRGQNQIGGSIVEISTDKTRIVFDVGINLDESAHIEVPKVEGLFCGEKQYDAVFVSHYHSDHIGLLDHLLADISVYMGEKAYNIFKAACDYRRIKHHFKLRYLHDGVTVQIEDMAITPMLCDHSASDSYMFLVEGNGRKVLYTGDFRANGRHNFDVLLARLPKVDALIIEGTTLSRSDSVDNIEEAFLEEIAVKALNKHQGPAFILMSAMNTDRLITAYNAARRTGRVFLEDLYTAEIAKNAGVDVPKPNGKFPARVFTTTGGKGEHYTKLQKYGDAITYKKEIAKTPFLMCVRASMFGYLNSLNKACSFEDGILFYGMWKGYMEQDSMKEFITFMQSKGVKLHVLHTSGHADEKTIDRLVTAVSPKTIIPVHTENADWFDRYPQIAVIKDCKNVKLN